MSHSSRIRYIVTIAGEDRPGILDDVTGVIQRNSGQVQDLRSVDAGGHFAMLITIEIGADAYEAFSHQLSEVAETRKLCAIVNRATGGCDRGQRNFRLVATGPEAVSMLKKLSHLLRVLSINIESIETRTESDGHLTLDLVLVVPRECPVAKLKEFIEQLVSTSRMHWELSPV